MVMVIDVLVNSCQIWSEKLLSATSLENGPDPSTKHPEYTTNSFYIAGILAAP